MATAERQRYPGLRPRRRRTLEAICETFAPGSVARGVPEAITEALELIPPAARRDLVRVLSVFAVRGFANAAPRRRQRMLLAWRDSRLPIRRAAFHALRKAVLVNAYLLPDAWEEIGYPGPLGLWAGPAPRAIEPLSVRGDVSLECDVCVIGSGAGGGTSAGVLATAGLDVVVLEAGGYYDDGDFDGDERSALRGLFLEGGAAATEDQGVGLLAGTCLGGGTVINYTTSFRTPDSIRGEWAAAGVPEFVSESYSSSLDAVCARMGVNREHNRPSRREEVFRRGLEALGWHVDSMPRNVRGCANGRECGWCPFGCRLGAKQSTTKTWLADAHAAGARILVRTQAERVLVERGTAAGVEARTADGHGVHVRSRAVVVAAGALRTPALLRRSGLSNANVGRHLRLHPVAAALGVFEEEIRPWEGVMQAIYSDEHADLDDGYGLKYETTAIHPGLPAALLPFESAGTHAELMRDLPHLVGVGVLLRDRSEGVVQPARDGRVRVRYRLDEFDRRHIRTGLAGAARILEAAGARRILTSHARVIEWQRGHGSLDGLLETADAVGYEPGRCQYYSFHQMGSARMGGSNRDAVCNPDGETWEVRNLVVCDASTFPTASGVNPMISIAAIAHMNASALAARLAR